MANLLSDQHIDPRLDAELRLLGHRVESVRKWTDKGGCEWSDEEILRFATQRRMAVVTCNRADFFAAATSMGWHCGLVVVPQENEIHKLRTLAKRIDERIKEVRSLKGQVITIISTKQRRKKAP